MGKVFLLELFGPQVSRHSTPTQIQSLLPPTITTCFPSIVRYLFWVLSNGVSGWYGGYSRNWPVRPRCFHGWLGLGCCFSPVVFASCMSLPCRPIIAASRVSRLSGAQKFEFPLFSSSHKNPVVFDFCIGKSSSGILLCIDMRRSCLPTCSLRSGFTDTPGLFFPLRRVSQKKAGFRPGSCVCRGLLVAAVVATERGS